jgi:hypothetical protein
VKARLAKRAQIAAARQRCASPHATNEPDLSGFRVAGADQVRCRRRDSNPHTRRHRNLNPACLPVPPLRQYSIASLAALVQRGSRLWSAPTSSSLGDHKHVPSLLLSTARGAIGCWIASLAALTQRGSRLWSAPTSSSLGNHKHVPSLLLSTARGAIRVGLLRSLRSLSADRA